MNVDMIVVESNFFFVSMKFGLPVKFSFKCSIDFMVAKRLHNYHQAIIIK